MASKAEVRYNSELIDPVKIAECVEELGFTASVMENYEGSDGNLELVVSQRTIMSTSCLCCINQTWNSLIYFHNNESLYKHLRSDW